MSEAENIKISVNEEDIQNLIHCYEKDIEYIKKLEKENKELKLKLLEKKCSDKDVEYKEKIKLQNRINKAIEYIKIYRSYQKIDNKDYLKGRDEIGCLDICQVDELLDILKEVE